MTTQITPLRTSLRLLLEVRFKLENDRVAQESNETLSISINRSVVEGLFHANTTFLLTMNITIMDADGEFHVKMLQPHQPVHNKHSLQNRQQKFQLWSTIEVEIHKMKISKRGIAKQGWNTKHASDVELF